MSEYHSNDFSFEEYAATISLPQLSDDYLGHSINAAAITTTGDSSNNDMTTVTKPVDTRNDYRDWDEFYSKRQGYKDRMYISKEFERWLKSVDDSKGTLIEIGCGHGSTMFPILDNYRGISYVASDVSSTALKMLQDHPKYDPTRVQPLTWDPSTMPLSSSAEVGGKLNSCLLIFTLSAVLPELHQVFLRNVATTLAPSSVILFRDYGLYDMVLSRVNILFCFTYTMYYFPFHNKYHVFC